MIGGLETMVYVRSKCGQFRCVRCRSWAVSESFGQYLCNTCTAADGIDSKGMNMKKGQRADVKNQAIDGAVCSEGKATLVRRTKLQPHPDDVARGWERWVVRFDGDHSDEVYERIVTPEDLL